MIYGLLKRVRLVDGKANYEMVFLPPAANIKGQTRCVM